MANSIVPNPLPLCRCCGQPMQADRQADGKGSSYLIVTCWNKSCGMYSVTRSLESYRKLTPDDIAAYCEMNRQPVQVAS